MSSSSVCQGLQSCLEPRVMMEPRVLRLKLDPPTHNKRDTTPTPNTGGWSFLHCNRTDEHQQQQQQQQVYVHPTVKRSSSMLSEKSLEMCTESLGCETGSNGSESSDEAASLLESVADARAAAAVPRRRVKRACSYPPPLTSITDFGGVRVRPRREGGRLILEAFPNSHDTLHRPYLHAERSDGRLRIRLFETPFLSDDEDEDEEEEEEEEYDDDDDDEECAVEEEMGVNKFGIPRRCNETGNRDIFGVDGYFELPSLSLCL